jgi:hypothetical protein
MLQMQFLDGTWLDTNITRVLGREVTVAVDPGATYLAYAWQGVVCEYKACSIYSADAEALPAQTWLWNIGLLSRRSY